MAKSARASSKKAARSKIRNSVYAPVEQQRLERLSARLMASISQPSTRTTQSDAMEEDDVTDAANRQEQRTQDRDSSALPQDSNTMELDKTSKPTVGKSKSAVSRSTRIAKERRRRSKGGSSVVFKVGNGRKRIGAKKVTKVSKRSRF